MGKLHIYYKYELKEIPHFYMNFHQHFPPPEFSIFGTRYNTVVRTIVHCGNTGLTS